VRFAVNGRIYLDSTLEFQLLNKNVAPYKDETEIDKRCFLSEITIFIRQNILNW